MVLSQVVNKEIIKLKTYSVTALRALPALEELEIIEGKYTISICIFREDSGDGRTIVVVKSFRKRWFWVDAFADGFAITADDVIVNLNSNELATLY
jgi:hypothetical protein